MVHLDSQFMQHLWILSSAGCSLGLAMGTWKPGPKRSKYFPWNKKGILTSEWRVYKHLAPSANSMKKDYHYWMNLEFMKHSLRISCFYSLFLSFLYSQHYILCWLFFPGCNLPKIKNKETYSQWVRFSTVPLWHRRLLNSQFQEDSQHLYRTHATSDVPRSPYNCSFQTQMPDWVTLPPAQGENPVKSSREVTRGTCCTQQFFCAIGDTTGFDICICLDVPIIH